MDGHGFRVSLFHRFMVEPAGGHCQRVETLLCQMPKTTNAELLVLFEHLRKNDC